MGPEKCGECHAIQYEQWKRSRHAKTVRFPGEHPEVDNDLKKKLYGSEASILPDGITADVIYATIGTPRTKYGYIDDVIEPRNTRFRVIRALQQLQTKKLSNPAKKHGNIPL